MVSEMGTGFNGVELLNGLLYVLGGVVILTGIVVWWMRLR